MNVDEAKGSGGLSGRRELMWMVTLFRDPGAVEQVNRKRMVLG